MGTTKCQLCRLSWVRILLVVRRKRFTYVAGNVPTEVLSQVVLPGEYSPANFAKIDHPKVAFALSTSRGHEVEVDRLLVREILAAVRADAAERVKVV